MSRPSRIVADETRAAALEIYMGPGGVHAAAEFAGVGKTAILTWARAAGLKRSLERQSAAERFHAKVDRSAGPDGCWPWTAGLHKSGYGSFRLRDRGVVPASRYAYELAHGEVVPADMCVCHRCDNPPCCNPAHLFVASKGENNTDCVTKGRRASKLTPSDVLEIRRLRATGLSYSKIAERFPVSASTVQSACNGRNWTHLDGVDR